ncbi:MAG: MmcQ/YjbR family DNA-binding protein [Acidobacteriia bacterium]|nr:MmcQ/YjbR family DNA-binding protein [Terriglobia bacterium]
MDWVREVCLALPHTTEDVQWEHDLLFRIAGKIYCVANLEPGLGPTKIAFKCTPERFTELVEVEGIIPAPYMARNHWVAMTEVDALRPPEIQELIEYSYRLVLEKLPKRKQAELSGTTPAPSRGKSARRPKPGGTRRSKSRTKTKAKRKARKKKTS